MNELGRLRRAYAALDEPSEDSVARARERLLREIVFAAPVSSSDNGRPPLRPAPARMNRRRRWSALAIAALVAVGVLLVTPAFGIGQRLLDLFRDVPHVSSPTWSPDGRRIAFYWFRGDNYDIYVMNADGSGQVRLTRHTAHETGQAWSPDGRRIAFRRAGRRGALPYDIYVMNADGSRQRRLVHGGVAHAWSPDGRRIAFMGGSRLADMSVFIVNPDGSDRRVLARAGSSFSLAWSPDGKQIAFLSFKDTVGVARGCSQVYVVEVDGTDERSLTQRPARRTRWCYRSLAWSPDGRKIAVVKASTAEPYGANAIYVIDAAGGGQARLTNTVEAIGEGGPAWSPDERKIVFSSEVAHVPNTGGEIFVMNPDGSGRRNLTRSPAHDSQPAWSPDGSTILFVSDRSGKSEFYVMNADGSGVRKLTRRDE